MRLTPIKCHSPPSHLITHVPFDHASQIRNYLPISVDWFVLFDWIASDLLHGRTLGYGNATELMKTIGIREGLPPIPSLDSA